ncbi:MAG: hypothetical protein V3R25_05665 [Nitrosomonadaceae bacterium]
MEVNKRIFVIWLTIFLTTVIMEFIWAVTVTGTFDVVGAITPSTWAALGAWLFSSVFNKGQNQ